MTRSLRRLFSSWFGLANEPSPTGPPLISKTKYLVGLQCSKALWIHYNNKALLPDVDPTLAAIFDQGHQVGQWAKKLYPGGVDLTDIAGFTESVKATREALRQGKAIFEASFIYDGCFSRADILVPTGEGRWDIIEVKSSGAPEDLDDLREVYLRDLAFQRYVYEGAGLVVRNCYLLLLNKNYVCAGAINPHELFRQIDVTDRVNTLVTKVHPRVEEMKQVLALAECPDVKVSPHCREPYECPLTSHCWSFLPHPSVFELRNAKNKPWDLLARGILRMEDLPADVALTDAQTRQVASHRSGNPHVDRAAIKEFLSRLQYPLYFLDFETIQSAIPLFDKCRPYTQVPFQFSLHVIQSKGRPVEHHGFLAKGKDDPRPALLAELRELLGDRGSIVGYNTTFESTRLAECALYFPQWGDWINVVSLRFIDLLEVFRGMFYYHPLQNGSASLKDVLPALTSTSYDGLQISDGAIASREFMRITFSRVGWWERRRVRKALEEYCSQDTSGLIAIVEALDRLLANTA